MTRDCSTGQSRLEAHTASPSDGGLHLPVEPPSLGKAFFMEPYNGLRMDGEQQPLMWRGRLTSEAIVSAV